jgi:hypothetical protein
LEEDADIDLEHFSVLRHTGKELIAQGENIAYPIFAYGWDYLLSSTLITIHNNDFRKEVKTKYQEAFIDADDLDFIPSVLEVADAIDEYNMIVIHDFYKNNGYSIDDIDVIIGNYIQEFSCSMEDWVEEVFRDFGYAYYGSSVSRCHDITDEYAPQNILLVEFLR